MRRDKWPRRGCRAPISPAPETRSKRFQGLISSSVGLGSVLAMRSEDLDEAPGGAGGEVPPGDVWPDQCLIVRPSSIEGDGALFGGRRGRSCQDLAASDLRELVAISRAEQRAADRSGTR